MNQKRLKVIFPSPMPSRDDIVKVCPGCGITVRWGQHGAKNWRLVTVLDRRIELSPGVATAIKDDARTSVKWVCNACVQQFYDKEDPDTVEWMAKKNGNGGKPAKASGKGKK